MCLSRFFCHLVAFAGISVKTHELYLLVFVTRYLDLFTTFYSFYNSIMKLVYIASTSAIIYTIKFQEPIKSTYEKGQDAFLHWQFAAAPCAILAFCIHLIGSGITGFSAMELLWTFSILLECITIMPQLVVLQRYREVENLTGNYVFFMGAYRALYILNWIYRANTEKAYKHHWVVYICGVIQTLLYADFFYYYLKRCVKLVGVARLLFCWRYFLVWIVCFRTVNSLSFACVSSLFLRFYQSNYSKAKGGKFSLPTSTKG